MSKFIKTRLLGGIVFLAPLVFVAAVVGKALSWTHILAAPLLAHLNVETVAQGVAAHMLSITILIGICFLTGLAASTTIASNLVQSLETDILLKFPPYALLKTKLDSVLKPEDSEKLNPVLVQFDDSWQVALDVDQVMDPKRLVFLPGAPDFWSGSICVVTEDRVKPLDASVQALVSRGV